MEKKENGMKFVIISGGSVDDGFVRNYLENENYDRLIAADAGMDFLYRNHIVPDIIAGDFDSVSPEGLARFMQMPEVEILRLNPIKDDTDTEFVIREAIRRGADQITILGATGTRLDHVMANVSLLGIGLEHHISIRIVDPHNRIRMTDHTLEIKKEEQFGNYVSVLPIGGAARGVTLEGMKYPLQEADMSCFSSLGISNEIVAPKAVITVREGVLVVVESRD